MISIVIPTLNERQNIGKLLDSISAQDTSEHIELIVADSHSTDGTRELVESYRGKFKALQIVEGGLPAKARNNGGRAASGEILLFMDADIALPDRAFLEKNLLYFRSHKLVVASVLFRAESIHWFDHALTRASNLAIRLLKYIHPLGSMCIVVSRDVFLKSGGYPEDRVMAEDHDFVARCTRFGRFDLLPMPIEFSVRRFDEEGRLTVVWKYILVTLHIIFVGPVTKPLFEYKFKHTEKEKGS